MQVYLLVVYKNLATYINTIEILNFITMDITLKIGSGSASVYYKDHGSLPLLLCQYEIDFRYPNI